MFLLVTLSYLKKKNKLNDGLKRSSIRPIDPSHKPHNALDGYPTIQYFATEMCTRAHFCYKMVHCGIWDRCIVGFVRWVSVYETGEHRDEHVAKRSG